MIGLTLTSEGLWKLAAGWLLWPIGACVLLDKEQPWKSQSKLLTGDVSTSLIFCFVSRDSTWGTRFSFKKQLRLSAPLAPVIKPIY